MITSQNLHVILHFYGEYNLYFPSETCDQTATNIITHTCISQIHQYLDVFKYIFRVQHEFVFEGL